MIRRPPRSTLFPTRRSSELGLPLELHHRCRADGDHAGTSTRRNRCAAQHNCDGLVQQGDECRHHHHGHLPPTCDRQHCVCTGNGNRQCRRHRCHSHAQQPVRVFFFNDTATTEIYTLSLHDALPI